MADTIILKIDCEIEKGWSQIPNAIINDENMSPKAKLLFIYLKARPRDWQVRTAHIQKTLNMGRDSVLSHLNELQEKGYIGRRQIHDGRYRCNEIILYWPAIQCPENQSTDNPFTEKQESGNQSTDNQGAYKERVKKTEDNNTEEEKKTDLKEEIKEEELPQAADYRIGFNSETNCFDGGISEAMREWIEKYPNVNVLTAVNKVREHVSVKGRHHNVNDFWDYIDNWLHQDAFGTSKPGYSGRKYKRKESSVGSIMDDIKAFANGEEVTR